MDTRTSSRAGTLRGGLTTVFAGLAAVLLVADAAPAAPQVSGSITAASGLVRVNGQQAKILPGKPYELNRGDLFDTQDATATWRSPAGDEVQLEPGTAARDEGVVDDVSALFVRWGLATAQISDRTLVGGAAGWASVAKDAKARVVLEVPKVRAAQEAHFRATEGSAVIRYDTYAVVLAQGLGATLAVDPRDRGLFSFRTSQQNGADVLVRRSVAAGDVLAIAPRGAIGECSDDGGVARIANDANSAPSAKIRVELWSKTKSPYAIAIEPGASAAIDASGVKPTPAPSAPPQAEGDDAPVATLARTADQPGTKLLGGAVECVGLSGEDDVRGGKLSAEVENVSGAALAGLEASVAFRDVLFLSDKPAETAWTPVPDLASGGRTAVEFDISKLGRVGRFAMVLRVRRK